MEMPVFGVGLQGKSPVITSQRRLNLYYEFQKDQDRTHVSILGTPGLSLFVDFGDTPVRGKIAVNNLNYMVHRGTFYSVNNAGVKTSLGILNTTTGRCDLAYNGTEILIVDGTNGYIYNITYNTFFQIDQISTSTTTATTSNKLTDGGGSFTSDGTKAGMIVNNTTDGTQATITAVDSDTALSLDSNIFTSGEDYEVGEGDFPNGATTCGWLDTYFLVELNDQFYISGNNKGMSWNTLDFASAESAPDGIKRVFIDHGEVILFGDVTTEYWGNTGNSDFPFSAVQGTSDEWGLAAKWSVAKFDNSLMYLASNTMGEVMLVRSSGYTPIPVNDDEWHTLINGYATVSDATAFSYLLGGHPMYQINFPSEGKSWLFDGKTQVFTELKSHDITRHRAEIYSHFLNKNYVSDYTNGKVYKLDPDVYTDNGEPILRQLRSKHVFSKNHVNMIIDRFQLLMATGSGLVSGQGSNPQAMLRYSKDLGRTWSTELWKDIGKIGKYIPRVIWRSLGRARDWVFELSISDPIKVVITGVNINGREGNT